MKQTSVIATALKLALVGLAGLQVACSSSDAVDSSVSTATLSGYVVAAPVNGASVTVKNAAGTELAGAVTTNPDGSYSVDVPVTDFDGIIVLESSGGTFTDEATGDTGVAAGALKAYVDGAAIAADGHVQLTPATTIVHDMVASDVSLELALQYFEEAFGFAADSVVAPADVVSPAADATTDELLAGLRMAVFSQLTSNLGLDPAQQFDLLTALANDLADGSLDGMAGGSPAAITALVSLPADIQSQFSQAFVDFHASANDNTGLDNDVISTSIPFAKVVLTDNYKVEYVTEAMPKMGRTEFTVRVSHVGGGVADGLAVVMAPMMHMPLDRNHSTPMLNCDDTAIAGDYVCTIYYLMPTADRGYWELGIEVEADVATFYPDVMMDMGARVVLKDLNDGDDATMEHNYFLFKENLDAASDEFTMYFAYMQNMMTLPAVGLELNTMSGLLPVVVQVSTAATPTVDDDWTDDIDWADVDGSSDDGFWVAPIPGFTNKIHVRLIIGGEQKSTDGKALGATVDPDTGEPIVNEYATFMIMTGM